LTGEEIAKILSEELEIDCHYDEVDDDTYRN